MLVLKEKEFFLKYKTVLDQVNIYFIHTTLREFFFGKLASFVILIP